MRHRRGLRMYLLLCLVLTGPGALPAPPRPDGPQLTAVHPKTAVTTPGSKVVLYGSGFSPGAVVYFGGLQVREARFVSSSALEVVTPYLRPGSYQLQLKSGGVTLRSEITFMASPSPIDAEIDRAIALAGQRQSPTAIGILTQIAGSNGDYQVRAFANYQIGQIYFALGDWVRWAGEGAGAFLNSDKSGMAVQTSWAYRLSDARSTYLLDVNTVPNYDLRLADIVVDFDVTQNPEPRFYRGLVNARYGNLPKAKVDSDFIVTQEPGNTSYRALAAYIAVLGGNKAQLQSFAGETIKDARALSLLGEAAYLNGDDAGAQQWWMLAAKEYPLGAGLAYLAGKKHLARGHQRVAVSLLNECATMAPNSKEGEEAKELLAKLQ